ncbi:Uncharacterised protein [Legionella pneumophila]|nr:Uncharacterised protein [Legionella pneumophila]
MVDDRVGIIPLKGRERFRIFEHILVLIDLIFVLIDLGFIFANLGSQYLAVLYPVHGIKNGCAICSNMRHPKRYQQYFIVHEALLCL